MADIPHEYIHMMYSFKLGMLAYIIILENEFASDPRGPWQSKLDFVQDQVRTNIFVPIKSVCWQTCTVKHELSYSTIEVSFSTSMKWTDS